jgi:hypothetical protein
MTILSNSEPDTNQATRPQTAPALGPEVAPTADEQGQGDYGLPPGAHPRDPSIPFGQDPAEVDRGGVGGDPAQSFYTTKGGRPFGTPNEDAWGVYQRAAHDWDGGVVKANASTNGGTATVVGRQKGRLSVKVWIPTVLGDGSTPLPALIGPNESELQTPGNNAPVLNVGDSIVLETEGSVYIGCVGANATATVQYVVFFNPPGGGGGGD